MTRSAAVALVALLSMPGCLTYSAVKKLSDMDHAVTGASTALVVGNVLGGAIVGGIAAGQSAPGDRGITFVQGMAAWNVLDICVGLPLAMIAIFGEKLDE